MNCKAIGRILAVIAMVLAPAAAAQAVLIQHSTAGILAYDNFETVASGDLPGNSPCAWKTTEYPGDLIRVTDSGPAGGAFQGNQCLEFTVQYSGDTNTVATYASQTTGTMHYEWMLYAVGGTEDPYAGGGSTPMFVLENVYMMAGTYHSDELQIYSYGEGWLTYDDMIIEKDVWHKMEVNYDFDAKQYEVIVDGDSTGWIKKFYPTQLNWFPGVPINSFMMADANRLETPFYIDASTDISIRLGDANIDGDVDAEDAAALAAHWLASGAGWLGGDFNNDGITDDIDATILATNWTGTSPSSSVPEPSEIAVIITALIACFFFKNRKG